MCFDETIVNVKQFRFVLLTESRNNVSLLHCFEFEENAAAGCLFKK